jgi:hypothetical protein
VIAGGMRAWTLSTIAANARVTGAWSVRRGAMRAIRAASMSFEEREALRALSAVRARAGVFIFT